MRDETTIPAPLNAQSTQDFPDKPAPQSGGLLLVKVIVGAVVLLLVYLLLSH